MAPRSVSESEEQDDRGAGDGSAVEAAAFIAESVAELTQLARRHHLDILGFLLDMSLLEANEIVKVASGRRTT